MEGEYSVRLYNTQTGEIRPVQSQYINGKTVFRTVLYDLDSLLLRYEKPAALGENAPVETAAGSARRLPVQKLVDYTLEEPNVYLMDCAEFALDSEPYQPETELLRADNVLRSLSLIHI